MELSTHLRDYLLGSRQIDALAVRQARLISRCITDDTVREELTIVCLLLLAALRKGSPRAGRETMLAPLDEELLAFHASGWRNDTAGAPDWLEEIGTKRRAAADTVEKLFTDATRFSPVAGQELQGVNASWPVIVTDGRLAGFSRFWCSAGSLERRHLPTLLAAPLYGVDESVVAAALHHVFVKRSLLSGDNRFHSRQIAAAALACFSRFLILSGGPGTGKTSVVVQLLRTLLHAFPDMTADRIALCAPTGRAKARLAESIDSGIERLSVVYGNHPDHRDRTDLSLAGLHRKTVHGLLGQRPDGTFRHDRDNPLPMQVVVVDEASMVPLNLFSALLDACGDSCRIILVGDMHQLPSVEAGAVLGDLTEVFATVPEQATLTRKTLEQVRRVVDGIPADGSEELERCLLPSSHHQEVGRLADHVMILTRSYRSSSSISACADAVNRGDVHEALRRIVASASGDGVAGDMAPGIQPIRRWLEDFFGDERIASAYRVLADTSRYPVDPEAQRAAAETVLRASAILTIVNEGPRGRRAVNRMAKELYRARTGAVQAGRFYYGMPVILGTNHHDLDLYNGDMGVVIHGENDGVKVLFPRGRHTVRVSPDLIPDAEPAFALTVHKSQGSEFDDVLLVLPEQESPLLTRQIVYTGITRAKRRVKILGGSAILASAIGRRERREGGLRIG